MYPAELKYTAEHEWAKAEGDSIRVGITDFAQEALGDIVYVSMPEVGVDVRAGQVFGEVESTKSVSDLYAPVSGTVVSRNAELTSRPELLNSDPYGEGWIVTIQPSDADALGSLLDVAAYQASLSGE